MTLAVELTTAARRDLKRLDPSDLERVDACILSLANDPRPRGSLKLQGERSLYRVRLGRLRVLNEIEPERIVVARIRHRRDAYRRG